MRNAILASALLLGATLTNAEACESGEKTYLVSGSFNGVSYTAVRVDWENSRVLVRGPDGVFRPLGGVTPADPDPKVFEYLVEQLIGREVTTNC